MELGSLGLPTKVHTGVMYVNKKPVYIIEVVEENGENAEFVTVYEAHRHKNEEDASIPVKAYDVVEKDMNYIKPTTLLGQLASKMVKPNKKRIKITKPPLFMTEIMVGKDTFTGKEGRGFYEREKDEVRITKKEGIGVKRGDRTGVFISLDSIIWEKVRVPTTDLVEEYQARKTLYFL